MAGDRGFRSDAIRAPWQHRRIFLSGRSPQGALSWFFVVFVRIGDSAAVAISSLVDRFSEPASLLVFFASFIFVFWLAWWLAVRIIDAQSRPCKLSRLGK